MAAKSRRLTPLQFCVLFYVTAWAVIIALHFPYATDPQRANKEVGGEAAKFYTQAYTGSKAQSTEEKNREEVYVRVAKRAAEIFDINGLVGRFVREYGLEHRRILEVGAGRGYLQDAVPDYTGLDISPTAARFFHKPFVLASATAMPFKDGEFDAIWSIWVLEHVPNPESALREMRRVVKPGGVILLAPAWFCTPWAADGYQVRPYSDFGIAGKITKASLVFRTSPVFHMFYTLPIRVMRQTASTFGTSPTAFHYTRLKPNYEKYWTADSDAVNSMDPLEAVLWFESRGDHCLNCSGGLKNILNAERWLVIRRS